MALTIRGNRPLSVFRLNGADENSATFALGWVLERSSSYRQIFIEAAFDEALGIDDAFIALQKHGEDGGYTDLEVQMGRRFHLILEAKRWWELPGMEQFSRYRPRLHAIGAERQAFVSVSAAD
ncbi:hypothetical protein [Shumkonia mesophila]|uniref:hypothetical protein n=1 Tax=Shumkonia mesophila TaxID=2838854 RepID=UPI00293434D1|nr:hypothetical protein [Shumkonia mesophila]